MTLIDKFHPQPRVKGCNFTLQQLHTNITKSPPVLPQHPGFILAAKTLASTPARCSTLLYFVCLLSMVDRLSTRCCSLDDYMLAFHVPLFPGCRLSSIVCCFDGWNPETKRFWHSDPKQPWLNGQVEKPSPEERPVLSIQWQCIRSVSGTNWPSPWPGTVCGNQHEKLVESSARNFQHTVSRLFQDCHVVHGRFNGALSRQDSSSFKAKVIGKTSRLQICLAQPYATSLFVACTRCSFRKGLELSHILGAKLNPTIQKDSENSSDSLIRELLIVRDNWGQIPTTNRHCHEPPIGMQNAFVMACIGLQVNVLGKLQ